MNSLTAAGLMGSLEDETERADRAENRLSFALPALEELDQRLTALREARERVFKAKDYKDARAAHEGLMVAVDAALRVHLSYREPIAAALDRKPKARRSA